MSPPATKQYECWTHETNWDLEPVLKFIPPLILPCNWYVESGHCYKLARPSPTKHYVRSTLELTWHLESLFKCHFLPLQQNNTLNKLRQFILSHFWKLRPPDPTQQYVKHVKKIGILSYFVDFVTVLLKALRSTYEPTWHPESCSKSILYSSKINTLNICMNKIEMLICLETFHPPSFPIHTLNAWRKIASWVILQFTTPRLTLQNKTFCIPRKLTCRIKFQIYPSRPYKENSWTFWNFINTLTLQINTFNNGSNWHVVIHSIGFTCPIPYKTLYLTYNQHGILTYVKMFIAFPYNKTIHWTHEKKESWVIFEIYSPSTLQNNTLNIWRDFACRVMLGISVFSTLPDKWFKIWRKLPCGVILKIYISSTLPS